MYCFEDKTNFFIAENASAIFLCPDFTPESAPVEEHPCCSCPAVLMLSDELTPVDVLKSDAGEEYLISSEMSEHTVSIAQIPLCADDHIACEEEKFNSVEVISVRDTLAEGTCPMFRFKKHIPSNFYITVYSREFYGDIACNGTVCETSYCCSVRGFVPDGMELKIRVQNFRL